MSEVKIGKHYLEVGPMKYFRGTGTGDARLGSFGKKKDPIGALAYLAVEGTVRHDFLKGSVTRPTTVTIDWSRERSAEVDANGKLKYFGLDVKAAVSGSYEDAKNAELKLVKFFIAEGPLKRILNEDADVARKFLAREGKGGRIVSAALVLMEGKLAEQFDTGIAIDVAVGADDALELSVSGGMHGSQTVELSKGTTFAFAMHKVTEWNEDKTKIRKVEDDWKGMG